MTNNNLIETIKKIASELIEENYWSEDWDGSASDVEQLIIKGLKTLLTKKDQEHKAELESIKGEIENSIAEPTELEDVRIYNIALKDTISILDSHINKL